MMRNFTFVLFFCICFVFSSFGQEHLSFKGIEMNCSTSSFAEKLSSQGYTIFYSSTDFYKLKGTFAGEPATIVLLGNENNHFINSVFVVFESSSSWTSLKHDYLLLKKTLQEKYGVGDSHEYFSGSYYEGDGFELQALRLEKCHYTTKFETNNGDIFITLSKEGAVELLYNDKISYELEKQSKDEQRYNDL